MWNEEDNKSRFATRARFFFGGKPLYVERYSYYAVTKQLLPRCAHAYE